MSQKTTAPSPHADAAEHLASTAAQAFKLGFEAYLWSYPLVLLHRTRDALLDPARRHHGTVNTLRTVPRLLTNRDRDVVKPNNDTLYVSGWLELRDGPVTLTVPAVDRYYSFQLLDAYTETWGYVGTRATGPHAGRYAVVGPEWSGATPEGATVLRAPTNTVWILGRVLIDGPGDLDAARAVCDSFRLDGPDVPAPGPSPAPSPHTVKDAGLGFFDELGTALNGNPPPDRDTDLVARLAAVGIGVGQVPSRDITDPTVRAALEAAVVVAHRSLTSGNRSAPSDGDGWSYDLSLGRYDDNRLLRSEVALKGLGALTAEEATYAGTSHDSDGDRLDGRQQYVLRFGADSLPPVGAFWSLTMYDEENFLVDNPIDRYSIGDRTTGMEYGEDGSLDIVLSHTRPPSAANWLPAPKGPFQLTLRFYMPGREILDGEYVVPPVRRV